MIGGGDFAIPDMIFSRYPKLGNLTIVEIDEKVIEAANKHFDRAKEIQEKHQNQLKIVIQDGAEFVRNAYSE